MVHQSYGLYFLFISLHDYIMAVVDIFLYTFWIFVIFCEACLFLFKLVIQLLANHLELT